MDFDPRYQESKNGPLTKDIRDRISAFRTLGSTLAEIGNALGLSGPFVSQLLNDKTPARIATKHIPRIIKVLEEREQKYMKKPTAPREEKSGNTGLPGMSLEDHLRAIKALGYGVTISV